MENFLSAASFIALYGVSYGLILFTLSVGLVITLGLMRVVNLAHGAFAAIGGYLALALVSGFHMPLIAAMAAAAVIVALGSMVIEKAIYVPLYASTGLDQVLMTVGLGFIATASLNFFFGPDVVAAKLPPFLTVNIDLGVRNFQAYRIFATVVGLVVVTSVWFMFERTGFGAKLRAAVDNRSMAEATGIDVRRLYSVSFAIGSGLAALGGAVGFAILPLEPLYPFKYLSLMLIIVTLAGMGNVKAAAVVAIMLGIVDTAARFLFPSVGAFVVYFLFIVLIMWRPHGIFSPR